MTGTGYQTPSIHHYFNCLFAEHLCAVCAVLRGLLCGGCKDLSELFLQGYVAVQQSTL